MNEKKLTLGVVGLGEGRSILSAACESDYWEVGCVCDLNEALCKERCKEFGLTNYTTDYAAMLLNPSIDVIGIYTPDQLHATHIQQALAAGKHVICTKPLMLSLEGAGELLQAQKKAGRHVFVGQSSRYFEPARRQRLDYEAGHHGELLTVETHYISDSRWFLTRDWSRKKDFSWLYNFMIHAVDLSLWYLPKVEEVYALGLTSGNSKALGLTPPDTIKVLLRESGGRFASVSGVYASPSLASHVEQSISCTLRGTRGISRAGYPKLTYYTKFEGLETATQLHSFEHLHDYYFRFEGETHHAGEYQNYLEDFARALLAGKTPLPDLREGLRTLAVMEAISRSLKSGTVVRTSDVRKEYGIPC